MSFEWNYSQGQMADKSLWLMNVDECWLMRWMQWKLMTSSVETLKTFSPPMQHQRRLVWLLGSHSRPLASCRSGLMAKHLWQVHSEDRMIQSHSITQSIPSSHLRSMRCCARYRTALRGRRHPLHVWFSKLLVCLAHAHNTSNSTTHQTINLNCMSAKAKGSHDQLWLCSTYVQLTLQSPGAQSTPKQTRCTVPGVCMCPILALFHFILHHHNLSKFGVAWSFQHVNSWTVRVTVVSCSWKGHFDKDDSERTKTC